MCIRDSSWAIDSGPIWAGGIIVKCHICFPQEVQDEAGYDKGAIDGGSENEFEAREFLNLSFFWLRLIIATGLTFLRAD